MTLTPIECVEADVAVVGSGFAGSLVSLALTRCGRRVAMIERGRHPRFAIGESSTPLANLLLEELAHRYDLPRIRPFSKWGTWQRARPDVAGGLKGGFTFYFHRPGEAFADDREWYRPEFDQALVREAESEGTIYLEETRLECIRDEGTTTRNTTRHWPPRPRRRHFSLRTDSSVSFRIRRFTGSRSLTRSCRHSLRCRNRGTGYGVHPRSSR